MINELGHFSLVLATVVAVLQASLPLYGAQTNNLRLMALARPAAVWQFLLILLSFMALTQAFVTSDFSLAVVANNSHSAKPMLYKVTGVWGNHEGSMLLWVLILACFGAAVAVFGGNLPAGLRSRVLSVQALIGLGFLVFILLTSNPFDRILPPPLDGRDLNPLLQDPGLAFHPPFLYLGYVGFSMAFAFAVAALIEGRVDSAWARWVRPWTLAAWCFLTLGIALGSWWAYYELGWGGWWFWDPVENASFMPWLAGTALLHSAIVVEKRGALRAWTILLAILTFSLSLIGTFLVRSGVLTSVHAFATDPERGVFILLLLVLAIGGSFALFALRAPSLKGGGLFQPVSREGALILNNLILTCATATVFFGTLYPLFLDALELGKISVGAPYFDATFGPLMVPLILLLPIGVLMPWKKADLLGVLQRLWIAGGLTILLVLLVWTLLYRGPVLALFGIALAGWLIFGALFELAERIRLFRVPVGTSMARLAGLPRAALGMTVAHLGLGVLVAAIVAMSSWRIEDIRELKPGESFALAGYELRFDGVERFQGPNYQSERGQFMLLRDGEEIGPLLPEKRFYPVQQMQTTEAGIRTTWISDIYLAIGDQRGDAWVIRSYFNPLAPWLWLGAIIMVLGGVISLTDRRYRLGAPQAKMPAGAKAQAA
jgi:cytochrome c-type biogenesis protein CcmF